MKLRNALIATAIAIPLAAFAKDPFIKGHPNMQKARAALMEAEKYITESQKVNEKVWGDEGGHGKRAKEAIETAKHEIDLAGEWVTSHEQK
jgi:hypothetical protein